MLPDVQTRQCRARLSSFFANCTNRQGELADFRNDELNRVYSFNVSDADQCKYDDVCRKVFHIARLRPQSFSSKMLVQISYMLAECCGKCANYYRSDVQFDDFAANISIADSYDIVYPVLNQLSSDNMHGFHFIPVFIVPGAFYLTLGKSKREISEDLVLACLSMWPLFVMCILLSLISGLVAWILETRANNQEFPTNFFLGIYEGFWWSFVSMTTVGYGDKTPKTFFGRLYSIIWILIGITMVAVFTATLTNAIMNSGNAAVSIDMTGKQVGILKNRLHDAVMVAQHEGIAHQIDFNDTVHGIRDLLEHLREKTFDGILISRSTYFYFYRTIIETDKYKHLPKEIEDINLIRVKKSFKDNQLAVGMLVKNKSDFEYFKKYYQSNWFQIQSCYLYSMNYKDKKFDVAKFDSLEGLFYPFFYWTIGILGVIVACGSVYELINYFLCKSEKASINVSVPA